MASSEKPKEEGSSLSRKRKLDNDYEPPVTKKRKLVPEHEEPQGAQVLVEAGLIHEDAAREIDKYIGQDRWEVGIGYGKVWRYGNRLHRDYDLPAAIRKDGSKFYYQYGKLHRENGPAIIYPWGDEYWYYRGRLHRKNGPAVITGQETKYYHNGKLHRDDGPAVISKGGAYDPKYYKHGHRVAPSQSKAPMKW